MSSAPVVEVSCFFLEEKEEDEGPDWTSVDSLEEKDRKVIEHKAMRSDSPVLFDPYFDPSYLGILDSQAAPFLAQSFGATVQG